MQSPELLKGTEIVLEGSFEGTVLSEKSVQIKAWCPFCVRHHLHGFPSTYEKGYKEHRGAHCSNKKISGYFIQMTDSLINGIRKRDPKMIDKLGGRKVLLGLFVMVLGVIVDSVAKNGLSPNLLDLLKFIGVGFFLGNGIEHVAVAVKERGNQFPFVPSPPSVDMTKVEKVLNSVEGMQTTISTRLSEIAEANVTTQQGIMHIITAAGLDQTQAEKNRKAIR